MKKDRTVMRDCMALLAILLGLLFLLGTGGALSKTKFSKQEKIWKIFFEENAIVAEKSDAIAVDGSTITIYKAGIYRVKGKLDDGQIIVNAGKNDEVELQFDNVDIHCEDSAPLLVMQADKLKIKLRRGSKNYLSDGIVHAMVPAGDHMTTSCIYSRADLTIRGPEGSLVVEGNYKHGISSSDDLKIKSGNISVKAAQSALRGNDSVQILGGTLNLTANTDGILSEYLVSILGGNVTIDAQKYGIYGRKYVNIGENCKLKIKNSKSAIASAGVKRVALPMEEIKEE